MPDPRNPVQDPGAAKSTRAKRKQAPADPLPASAEVTRITASDRHGIIATAAYYRAERRQFTPGFEVEDWIAAEAEVDASLARGEGAS